MVNKDKYIKQCSAYSKMANHMLTFERTVCREHWGAVAAAVHC